MSYYLLGKTPSIPLSALVAETVETPAVGLAYGAMFAAKSLMNIVGGPLEGALYTLFDGAGLF